MKLKKLLSEIGVEQMKVYSNPYATAFKPMEEDETQDSAEVMVGNYQTKYFDICPGATAVYKDIESKGVDMDMAERAAKLQDALFFIEKHVLNDNETGSAEGYITVAENLADQIMAMAGMMGLEEEHSYIQGHVDKITKAVSGDESVNEAYVVMYSKKKGEKPAAAAFQLRGSALSFERDLKKDGYITMITQKKVKGVDESVNEDTKKRFDVDFYKSDRGRTPSYEEIIRGDKFSDVVLQATKVAKSKGMVYVEFYYKDAFIGSIDKRNNYTFKKGRSFQKSPLSVDESSDVYHKSYTHAIEAAEVYARKKGYEIDDDEMFTKVAMNSKRPSVGKTTRVSLELLKNGKPQRKMLHIQVYGMKNGYELNTYIN